MKTLINTEIKKIKGLLIISVLFVSTTCFAYNWQGYGPANVDANNICFNVCGGHTIICASNGIYVDSSNGNWNFYSCSGLPVWEAIGFDSVNILLVMGNGSYSDGIYKFNLTNHQFNVVEWYYIPTFIKFNPNNNLYYVGSRYNGMLSSTDGIQWDAVPYFVNKGAAAMDFYNDHITVAQENNIFATYYSNDGGITWNQSTSNIPIHDLAYDFNGKLYGVYTGVSNSSGLYSSNDGGITWTIESWSDNINTVGFDVTGNVFAGWHNDPYNGIAMFTTQTMPPWTPYDSGLPNKNVNKIKYNPILSTTTIYCCTDSGVYRLNDYWTGINDIKNSPAFTLSNYPNPFSSHTTIEYTMPEKSTTQASLIITDTKGQKVKELNLDCSKGTHQAELNASSLNSGIYYYTLKIDGYAISRKMICIK